MNYINLNGKIIAGADAQVPVDNGAFRYGYGLFETMLVKDGVIELGSYHWERLFSGSKQLYLELPALINGERMEEEVLTTVKKNKLEHLCRVRVQIYAGSGSLYESGSKHAGFVIECFSLDESSLAINENGLVVGIAAGVHKSMDHLSNLKSCSALIYAVAAGQAKEHKWNDALICNVHGNVVESTIANIFWIKDSIIYTPPLSDGCVAGVMRRYIIEQTNAKEASLSVTDLIDADEVFLTNSIKKIRWIGSIGTKSYGGTTARNISFSIM